MVFIVTQQKPESRIFKKNNLTKTSTNKQETVLYIPLGS